MRTCFPSSFFNTFACLLLISLPLLSSCGGSSKNDDGDGQDTVVSRIQITPATALLSELDQTLALQATAYNAEGEVLDVDFSWASSNPDLMSVNQQGLVTNLDYSGSATITATVEDIQGSSTLLAVSLMPNSVLVEDAQVLSAPEMENPEVTATVGSRYQVTVASSVETTIGDLLIGSETAAIGGRVVEVVDNGTSKTVTLELLPLNELFSELKIDETFHFTVDDIELPEAVSEFYDVTENSDGSLDFTPKDGIGNPNTDYQARDAFAVGTPVGTVANPFHPFDCKAELTPDSLPIPLSINTLPISNGLNIDLDLIIQYDSSGENLRKLAVAGEVKAEVKITPTLDIAAEGKVECKLELVVLPVPIGGPVALVLGGQIPIGLGFEASGKITVAQMGMDIHANAQLNAEIGVEYQLATASWELVTSSDSQAQADYSVVLPNSQNLDAQLRLEPSLKGFLFADLELGNRFIQALRLETFTMGAGAVESANLATVDGQILDAAYNSDYKLVLQFNGNLGSDADSIFNFLGINASADLYKIELPLFTSPVLESATASVSSFSLGELVEFSVDLKTDSLSYYSLSSLEPYNIDDIIIYRKTDNGGSISSTEIARVSATSGQSHFTLTWTADSSGEIATDFYVFVDTRALEIPFTQGASLPYLDELELGVVSVYEPETLIAFVSNRSGRQHIWTMKPDGSDPVDLTLDEVNEFDPAWSPDGSKLVFTRYEGGNDEIFVMNADGSNRINLSNNEAAEFAPAWSPDGSKIAFVRTTQDKSHEIFVMNADGSNQTNLTNQAFADIFPAWSPDGSKIAFTSDRDDYPETYVMNADGSNVVQLTDSSGSFDGQPAWSPDGTKIAFASSRDNLTYNIFVMNANGSSETNLSNTVDGADTQPEWSADGSQIVFTSTRDNYDYEVYIMNADGSNPTNLSNNPGSRDEYPDWR